LPLYFASSMTGVRSIRVQDLSALKEVIDSTQLFPSDQLDEMAAEYFKGECSREIWLTKEVEDIPIAIAYCAPEKMTEGTYNLLLIAVHKNHQGQGIGAEMMLFLEVYLSSIGSRILIVETSSLPEYELTRRFYSKMKYHQQAVIPEFYQEGEDKVVFWKKL
jgi:ribosomal protein S18 acetylase RimI-like enzyme